MMTIMTMTAAGYWRKIDMIKQIKEFFCRHAWKPLRTEYKYSIRYETVTVKRCQCRKCGKIDYIHFNGKKIV